MGYKELVDVVEHGSSLAEAVEQIILRTRQFAVRQERWFRRDPRIHWLAWDRPDLVEAAYAVGGPHGDGRPEAAGQGGPGLSAMGD